VDEARAQGIVTLVIPANWEKYGLRAGFLRNTEIVAEADEVVAFWDGESKGTQDTIKKAKEAGKLKVVFGPTGVGSGS